MAMKKINGYNIIDTSAGQANGVATLTAERKIPSNQLPEPFGDSLITSKDYNKNILIWAQAVKNGEYKPTAWTESAITNCVYAFRIDEDTILWFPYSTTAINPNCYKYSLSTGQNTPAHIAQLQYIDYALAFQGRLFIVGLIPNTSDYLFLESTDKGETWQINTTSLPWSQSFHIVGQYAYGFRGASNNVGGNNISVLDSNFVTHQYSLPYCTAYCVGDSALELFAIGHTAFSTMTQHIYHFQPDGTRTEISPPNVIFYAYAIAYMNGVLTIWCNSESHPGYRSFDKGATWTEISTGKGGPARTCCIKTNEYCYIVKNNGGTATLQYTANGTSFYTVLTKTGAGFGSLQQINDMVFFAALDALYLLQGATAIKLIDIEPYYSRGPALSFFADTYHTISSAEKRLNYSTPEPLYLT